MSLVAEPYGESIDEGTAVHQQEEEDDNAANQRQQPAAKSPPNRGENAGNMDCDNTADEEEGGQYTEQEQVDQGEEEEQEGVGEQEC